MVKRAVASPREAEEQRTLARQRSATRRVVPRSDETEQHQQALTNKKTTVQRAAKPKPVKLQGKSTNNDNIEWPKAVNMDCKINCLKKFVQNMSMNSLAEGVCSICNARGYRRDLHHVPLAKIPSIELLKVHDDLFGIIPGIQQNNDLILNDNSNIIDNLHLSIAEHDRKAGLGLPFARFFMSIRTFLL